MPFDVRRGAAAAFWCGFRSLGWRDMHESEKIDALAHWLAEHGPCTIEPKQPTADGAKLDQAIADELLEMKRDVSDLRERIEAPHDRGVWRSGEHYLRDQWATDRGSLWIARRDTASRPGSDDSWRLAAKGRR